MPKNKGKGGKSRRRGKNDANEQFNKRELRGKDEGEEYGQVIKMLGNGRLEAFCYDGKTRQCRIRGKLQKKVWINKDDIILVSLRDFEDGKCDVIHKYTPDEIAQLKKSGKLPTKATINDENEPENASDAEDIGFTFEEL